MPLRHACGFFLAEFSHLSDVHSNADAQRLGIPRLGVHRVLKAQGGADGVRRRCKPRKKSVARVVEDRGGRGAGDDLPEKGIVPRDQICV